MYFNVRFYDLCFKGMGSGSYLAGIRFCMTLAINRSDDGLIEKPKLVARVVVNCCE